MFGTLGAAAGGKRGPSAKSATVSNSGTGTIYTITRLLGSSSTLALISGTNSNLTLSGANIQATAALGAGTSQTAVVRETSGQLAVEYPVVLSGAPAVLAISGTPGTASLSSSYSFTPTVTGGSGTKTYSYSGTTLSLYGLSLSPSTGAITGTVSGSAGTITGTITVTDLTGSATLSISIAVSTAVTRSPPPIFFNTNTTINNNMYPVALTQDTTKTGAAQWGSTYSSATWRDTGTTYYVAKTGSDSTGDGSSGNPWATLTKAHNSAAAGSQVTVRPGQYDPISIGYALVMAHITSGSNVFTVDSVISGTVQPGMVIMGMQAATSGNGQNGTLAQTNTGNGAGGNGTYTMVANANITAGSAGSPQFAFLQMPITKNISFVAETDDTVYVGNFLRNSDVASWGTLASGRQQITLNSGYVFGFVDLTTRYPSSLRSYPKVAKWGTSAAAIAQQQALAMPVGGIFWGSGGSGSYLGSADARDLTNSFDTDLLAWADNQQSPLLVSAARVYSRGIFWVGGHERAAVNNGKIVLEKGGFLGSGSQYYSSTAGGMSDQTVIHMGGSTGVYKDCAIIGSAVDGLGTDNLDYQNNSVGTVINCVIGQSPDASGAQAATYHGSLGVLYIGCTFFNQYSMVGDLGPSLSGIFGAQVMHTNVSQNADFQQINVAVEHHIADVTFLDSRTDVPAVNPQVVGAAAVLYDNTVSARASGLGAIINRAAAGLPVSDQVTAQIIVDLPYLFQDTAGTVPVTAAGQTVQRVNDPAVSGQYWTAVSGSTITYQDTPKRLVFSGTSSLQLNGKPSSDTFGVSDVVYGLKTTDTSFRMFGVAASMNVNHTFGDAFTSGQHPSSAMTWQGTASVYRVDRGSPVTTKGNLSTALSGGAPHVVSIENLDLNPFFWNFMTIGNAGANPYTGDFFGMIISKHGTAGGLAANQATIAAASGVTLP